MTASSGKFLLVDTSDRIAMVGIYDGEQVLAETRSCQGRPMSETSALGASETLTRPMSETSALGASETLTRPTSETSALGASETLTRPTLGWVCRAISELEDSAETHLCDLKFLACGIGPGGFTSLRIGMSLMKAMGQALGIPLVGVNRLEAAAMGQAILSPSSSAQFLVRLPAAQNLEYMALYRIDPGKLPVSLRLPAALSPQKISKLRLPQDAICVTAGCDHFYLGIPRVAHLKACAGQFESADRLVPLYLRGATLGPPGTSVKVARKRVLR